MLKSTISRSNIKAVKGEKEEENVALASKVPVRDRGRRRRRIYLRSIASGVASFATTIRSVLSGRRTSWRSKTKRQCPQR